MPGPLIDCYVLAPARSAKLAKQFLDHFLPQREPSFAPEDPVEVLGVAPTATLDDILAFLESNPQVNYNMYWGNLLTQKPYFAFLVFNDDGSMILGMSPCTVTEEQIADQYLQQMKDLAGIDKGYWFVEDPPAMNIASFEAKLYSFIQGNGG